MCAIAQTQLPRASPLAGNGTTGNSGMVVNSGLPVTPRPAG
ncbi:hypothetical protein [Azospirillum aestuarii]|nr:hypothetical protein [Azospirillum aestuarii]